MKKLKPALCILPVGMLLAFSFINRLHPTGKSNIKVPEPSDICVSASANSLYVASDQGYLYETDLKGKIIRRSDFTGTDFEAVYADKNFVYVMDEAARRVYKLDILNLHKVSAYDLPYPGARNSGFESITFNEKKNLFITVSEKNPVTIYEYDSLFKKVNEVSFNKARDISAAAWHDGSVWLLSDEDMKIFRLDPDTYNVINEFSINILNPEGLAFDRDGNFIVCSDDLQKLYYFNKP